MKTKNTQSIIKAQFVRIHDGGRAFAGYKGTTGDCVTRAIAICENISYEDAYEIVQTFSKDSPRNGLKKTQTRKILANRGYVWTPVMGIGTGCTMHLNPGELPGGHIICKLSKHVVACIDHIPYDSYDSSRNGTRCVYGFWSRP